MFVDGNVLFGRLVIRKVHRPTHLGGYPSPCLPNWAGCPKGELERLGHGEHMFCCTCEVPIEELSSPWTFVALSFAP